MPATVWPVAAILPLLVMPPAKVETPVTTMTPPD
jgi:hypothetical protein